ncbi:MAG: hypothetical protein AB1599_11050 [Planctomycetota bacterium]
MSKNGFLKKAFIPRFKTIPFDEVEKWGERYLSKFPELQKGALKAVPDARAFRKKIAKPIIEAAKKFIRDDFVSRGELSKQEIISRMESSSSDKDTAERYRRGIKDSADKVADKLSLLKFKMAMAQTFGSKKGEAAIEEVIGALSGQPLALTPAVRQTSIETDYTNRQLNPADYLGTSKKAYFDMYLEVVVSSE